MSFAQHIRFFLILFIITLTSSCADHRTPAQLTDALLKAAAQGKTTEIKKLLQKGADVNGEGHPSGDLPLRLAAVNGYVECVKLLLEAGADPLRTAPCGKTRSTVFMGRPLAAVMPYYYSLKEEKEKTSPRIWPMDPKQMKDMQDRGITIEDYEEIIRLLEEAEKQVSAIK